MSSLENCLYPPRPGTNVETVNSDFATTTQLSRESLDGVLDFEKQLYLAALDPVLFPRAEAYRAERGGDIQPIESVWQRKINSTKLGISYFMTADGRDILHEVTGIDTSAYDTPSACVQILSSLDIHGIDSSKLDKLEAYSVGYEEKQITHSFIESGYDSSGISAPNIITKFKNPEVIEQKARGYRNLKNYLKLAIEDLKNSGVDEEPELKAKLLIAELYKRRMNVLLVSTYISAYKLLSQNRTSGTEDNQNVIAQLNESLPAFLTGADNNRIAGFLQRMDRLTQGVSRTEDCSFTWLSPEAEHLAEHGNIGMTEEKDIDRGPYSDIDPSSLEAVQIDGETFGDWVYGVLEAYDLLSEHQEWDSERESFAPDGKWQVIVDDKFKALSVDTVQRVVKVPVKLTSIARAIPLINHEVTHVIQNENRRAISSLAIFDRVGIEGVSEQSEAGAIWQETVAREAILGKVDTEINGTSYLAALRIKSKGGTFGECVKAYYDDLTIRMPDLSPDKIAAQSVNRTLRLFRSGGLEFAQESPYLTNTQPLNYLEQRLIYESLDEQTRKLLFVGGVAINNFSRMSDAGLIDVGAIHIPENQPWQILYDPVVKELAKSLRN